MPIARHLSLITLDGVKDLIARKVEFTCRYELVGGTGDGKPLYQCIYSVQKHGPKVRHFALWPGLVNHHTSYGDGRPVSLDLDIRNAPEGDGGPDGDQS